MTVEEIRAELDKAKARLDEAFPADSGDPALARLGPRALKQHHRSTDRDLRRYTALVGRVSALGYQLARALHAEAEKARVPFTAEQLAGATHVEDGAGWARVVRVNKQSVTVVTGYSWEDRIPIKKILNFSPREVS